MPPSPDRALFLCQDPSAVERVYADRRQRIATLLPTGARVLRAEELADNAPALAAVEVVFSTWGMPLLTPQQLGHLPSLRAVCYAAGSVKAFATPLLQHGIQVSSAWRANAVPVAEHTLAHILLALKQTLHWARAVRAGRGHHDLVRPPVTTGAYGATVGLIGLGAIGRRVAELCQPFALRIIAHDPASGAGDGIERVGLDELMRISDVVSLHAPWIPATEGMITGAALRLMRPWSTFINTARGALVREDELIAVLHERPDLQAVLDVTWPEPPPRASALYDLDNVLLTPHIAGSAGNELQRMADSMIDECTRLLAGTPLQHAVTLAMLPTMA